jgi:GTP cyclohydrolase II
MGFFSKDELLGLDIGSNSIKAVELDWRKKSPRLKLFGMIQLPPEAIVDGAFMDSASIVDSIRSLIDGLKVKTKNVAVSISGHSVYIKTINVPSMSKEQLEELYVTRNMTAYEISLRLHCGEKKLSHLLRNFGIPTKRLAKQDLKRNLQNEKFGKLLVRNKHHVEEKSGDIFWECECDCGQILVTRARNLLRVRGSRSCGCKKTRVPWKIIPQFIWGSIESKANVRNIPFKISREFAERLFEKQGGRCALSGTKIEFAQKRRDFGLTTASLDRIDSSKAYLEDNVQWVHKVINKMKHNLETRLFVEMCKMVAKHDR